MTAKYRPRHLTQCAVVAAAGLAAAGAAQAQSSVTLYGRVDVGVQYSNKTGNSDSKLSEVANGGIRPSIWGMKGTEDLGGGLTAFFNLEAHLFADTGTAGGPGAGRLGSGGFRRQANVGLKGEWGAITLGRQYSPAIIAGLGTEPRAYKEQFSGLYPYARYQNPPGNPVNDLGIFLGNAVSYSGNFGPVYVGVAGAAGEGTGRTIALGASYTGPVIVSAAYQQIKQAVPGLGGDETGTKYYSGGVAVPLGAFTLKGQWQRFVGENADPLTQVAPGIFKVDAVGVGADWAWSPTNTLNGTFYYIKDKDGNDDKTKTIVVSNDLALSKRTTVYAQLAYTNASAGASPLNSVIVNGVFPNAKTTVFGVGVSHNF